MSLLLSSCGTKGILYIPEEKYPQAMMQEKIYVTKFLVVT